MLIGFKLTPKDLRCSPTTAYAPWFNVVLKCARLSIGLLKSLTEEVRSCLSRLSGRTLSVIQFYSSLDLSRDSCKRVHVERTGLLVVRVIEQLQGAKTPDHLVL